jgi:hypothetical protein
MRQSQLLYGNAGGDFVSYGNKLIKFSYGRFELFQVWDLFGVLRLLNYTGTICAVGSLRFITS